MNKCKEKCREFFRWTPEKKTLLTDLILIALIISGVVLISYKANGIYPFGDASVARGDMVQQTIPAGMYYVWDIFHGKASPFFTWESAFGMNISGAVSLGAFLSPLNLLLLLSPRNYLADFVNYFVILKMICIAYAMYFYLKKYRLKNAIYVMGGILYAFGAASLVHFQIMMVMDIAFFLPLLMIGVQRILDKKGCKYFIIMLAWALMVDVYTGVITLLFLLFSCGAKVFLGHLEKQEKKRVSLQLGVSVAIGLALSAVVSIPALISISNAPRTSYGSMLSNYLAALQSSWSESEWMTVKRMMINMALPVACILFYLPSSVLKSVPKKKPTFWQKLAFYREHIFMTVIMILSICIAGTELLWHGGSRASWPIRFFYMISFVLIDFAAAVYENHKPLVRKISQKKSASPKTNGKKADSKKKDEEKDSLQGNELVRKGLVLVVCLLGAVVSWLLFPGIYQSFITSGSDLYLKNGEGALCIIVELLFAVIYLVVFFTPKRNIIWFLLCVELTCTSIISFAPNKDNGGYWSVDYLKAANQVSKTMTTDTEAFERIKNNDYKVDQIEYSLVLGEESISNYWHVYTTALQSNFAQLGYTTNWTQFLDTGGTIFSDTLFQIKYVLTQKNLSEKLYDFCENVSGYGEDVLNIYQNKSTLPFAINTDTSSLDFSGELFTTQNTLFQAVTGSDGLLLEDISSQISDNVLNLSVGDAGKVLYFYGTNDSATPVTIYVNGEAIQIPASSSYDNVLYPADFGNGLVCLGSFQNEDVQVIFSGSVDVSALHVAALDYDTFAAAIEQVEENNPTITSLKQKKSGLTLKLEDVTKENIFLPVSYDEGWVCKVNGKKVEVNSIDGMVSIPVQEGDVTISLTYVSPGRYRGLLITLVALFLLVGYVVLDKRGQMKEGTLLTVVQTVAWVIFGIVYFALVVIYFVIPFIYHFK